jgi:hypothetical protein
MLKLRIAIVAAVMFSAWAQANHHHHFVPRPTEPLPPVNVP